ncbi:Sodium-dependent low-affinity dicarboxylate transporter 1 [Hypsibius exemplaris]|uniref:Sodium-dependent low-affinity dicarboxylate transporter 1 n=1 Tax=Hypsibius exemplaris TaxID=2072580 RepID=A0A1W0WLG6_HYPEX|nr:Sodium-dependent low-affinity dicarboxylate transporter 1 [Hypsibius exemplaris]
MANFLQCLKKVFRNAGIWKLILFFSVPALLSPIMILSDSPSAKAGYVLLIVSTFLVFEIVPIPATVLLAIFLMAVSGVQSTVETGKSFATETFFLFTSVLILAISIEETMLHNRLALLTLRVIGVSPSRLILGFLLISGLLSMWMSNAAVTLMILPIALAVSESLSPEEPEDLDVPAGIPYEERVRRLSVAVEQLRKMSVVNAIRGPIKLQDIMNDEEDEENAIIDRSRFLADTATAPVSRASLENAGIVLRKISGNGDNPALGISKALQLSTAYAANIGGLATLIGAYPNMVLKINVEKMYGTETGLNFMTFLFVCAPVTLGALFLSWIVLSAVFIPGWLRCWVKDPKAEQGRKRVMSALNQKLKLLGPIRQSEITVIVVFLSVIVLWLTRDPRIVPGWASLLQPRCGSDSVPAMIGAVLLFVLPVSTRDLLNGHYAPILTWKRVVLKFPWELLLFAGGLTAFAALADKSGLITTLGQQVPDLSGIPPIVVAGGVSVLASCLTEFMSNSVLTAILTPILANVAEDMGINPLYFMLAATISAQFAFMVPISSFPTVIVKGFGTVSMQDMMKSGIGPKIVCLSFLILSLETIGGFVFDLKTLPPWAEERWQRRMALVVNDTVTGFLKGASGQPSNVAFSLLNATV